MRHVQGEQLRHHRMLWCQLAYACLPALAGVGGAHDVARVEGALDELGYCQLGVGLGAFAVSLVDWRFGLGWVVDVWGQGEA